MDGECIKQAAHSLVSIYFVSTPLFTGLPFATLHWASKECDGNKASICNITIRAYDIPRYTDNVTVSFQLRH